MSAANYTADQEESTLYATLEYKAVHVGCFIKQRVMTKQLWGLQHNIRKLFNKSVALIRTIK
jgi:hypothetical protein